MDSAGSNLRSQRRRFGPINSRPDRRLQLRNHRTTFLTVRRDHRPDPLASAIPCLAPCPLSDSRSSTTNRIACSAKVFAGSTSGVVRNRKELSPCVSKRCARFRFCFVPGTSCVPQRNPSTRAASSWLTNEAADNASLWWITANTYRNASRNRSSEARSRASGSIVRNFTSRIRCARRNWSNTPNSRRVAGVRLRTPAVIPRSGNRGPKTDPSHPSVDNLGNPNTYRARSMTPPDLWLAPRKHRASGRSKS